MTSIAFFRSSLLKGLMSKPYAHNDRKRGGKATVLWLVEETGELAEDIRREEPENIEEELADCFAWIGDLPNLYGVNL
uniref:NTP pyrophosphohydrolase MazG-like domain-containing protein n=2 Tax=Methanosarcina barkeri TaxID=2208 RepID=Q46CC6_METBF